MYNKVVGIQCDANKLLQVTAVVAKAEIRRLLCHGGGEPHFFIVLPEHQHATWQNVWICGIKQGYFGSVVMSKYTSPVVLTKSGKMWAYYTLCLRLWFSVDDKPFRQRMLSNLLIVPLYSPDKNWVFLPNHSTNQQLYQHMGTSETLSAFVSTLEKTRLGGVRVGSFYPVIWSEIISGANISDSREKNILSELLLLRFDKRGMGTFHPSWKW